MNEFQSYYANQDFVVVSNTNNIQAVKSKRAGLYGVVFYEAGTIDFGKNFKVTADRAAIVIISKQGLKYNIAVADPMYNAESINLTINRKVEGENVLSGNAKSVVHFKMPSGDMSGSTISTNYNINGFEN